MKPIPSRSWTTTSPIALSASRTRPRVDCGPASLGGGGAAGSVQQKTAATKYSTATTAISAGAPAIFTMSGPRRVNPTAKAAFSVSVKIPFADISCRFGTSFGIIAASAGPKVAFIAGRTAPEGKRMGHAGAIISGGAGTAASKVAALEAAGFRIAGSPTELPTLLREAGYRS